MPIFEYKCRKCGHAFEELVSRADTPVPCPQCGSTDTVKQISAFAASTGGRGQVSAGGGCSTGSGFS